MADRPLTSRQVADLFGASVSAVATWADEGKLPCFRTPGGQRRFRRADVERFITEQLETTPAATEAAS